MDIEDFFQTALNDDTGVLTITLSRGDDKKNQLSIAMVDALRSILQPELTQPTCKGLILASAKEKVFSTGADIEADLRHLSPEEAAGYSREGCKVFGMLTKLPCPTVAALSGFTLGGGLELALCCDFRVATKGARLGLPEINLGVMPGWGGTQRLQRLIGRSRALRIILSGAPVNAAAALDWGLVDEVVDTYQQLLPAAEKILAQFTGKSPRAVAMAKRAVYEGGDMDLVAALNHESDLFRLAWSTADRQEGISAFLEKRRPIWPD
ncbi:enoyl-CoA hydratase/isomerase family protein [bacterium]|nr:enoyl-CoA hydratase/isomerase family protein [bacterium]